jgi:hypothetical protein
MSTLGRFKAFGSVTNPAHLRKLAELSTSNTGLGPFDTLGATKRKQKMVNSKQYSPPTQRTLGPFNILGRAVREATI